MAVRKLRCVRCEKRYTPPPRTGSRGRPNLYCSPKCRREAIKDRIKAEGFEEGTALLESVRILAMGGQRQAEKADDEIRAVLRSLTTDPRPMPPPVVRALLTKTVIPILNQHLMLLAKVNAVPGDRRAGSPET